MPWLGRRPIAEIDAPEVLACLRRVPARGAIETAHRLQDACGQVFICGIATSACARNPAADLRDALPPVPTRHLAAIVEPQRADDRAQYLEQRRDLMKRWADCLEQLRAGSDGADGAIGRHPSAWRGDG